MRSVFKAQVKGEYLDSSSCKSGETELRTTQTKNGILDALAYLHILLFHLTIEAQNWKQPKARKTERDHGLRREKGDLENRY